MVVFNIAINIVRGDLMDITLERESGLVSGTFRTNIIGADTK